METMNFSDLNNENNNQNNNQAAPKALRNKKLIWSGAVLAALILAVIGWQYWQYMHSAYYQQTKAVKLIEAQQRESDKWGGKTPEETVRLFTEAVKKGDFELASKYGRSELIKSELEKMKNNNQLGLLIRELEVGKIKQFSNGNDANLMANIDGLNVRVLSMHKSDGGTWKIDEF